MNEKRIETLASDTAFGERCEAIRTAINEALEEAAVGMCRPTDEADSEWIARATAQARIRALKVTR